MDNSIKVIIRFKAYHDPIEEQQSNWVIEQDQVTYRTEKLMEIYNFNVILPPITPQEEVFEEIVTPKLDYLYDFQGYNSAVFAYGATSSGKTYTILGPDSTINMLLQSQDQYTIDVDAGILPRSFLQIVEGVRALQDNPEIASVSLTASYVEIYNEAIYDLLNPQFKNKDQRVELKISSVAEGPKLANVKECKVVQVSDLFDLIALGTKTRSVGVTQFNARSSRSHVIFTIGLVVVSIDKSVRTSKIQFVDLAGSERLAKQAASGQLLEETKKINQSLSCLGFCIMALSSKSKHVPYRDSKLTTLLKECLGGNSNTSFICAVSGAIEHEDKTIQTLKFAQRAKKIVNKVKLNIKLSYEQIEKQLNLLRQEMGQMEYVLQKNGITYDRQFVKEEYKAIQLQKSATVPEINLQKLTEQYRASIRKTASKKERQNIKEDFQRKFQAYVENAGVTFPSPILMDSSRKQSSLPVSCERMSEEDEIDQTKSMGSVPDAILEGSDKVVEINGRLYTLEQLDSLELYGDKGNYNSVGLQSGQTCGTIIVKDLDLDTSELVANRKPFQQQEEILLKKRDSCCHIM